MAEIPNDLAQLYKEGKLNKAELGLVLFRRGVIDNSQFTKIVEKNKFFPVREEALKTVGGIGMDILRLAGAGGMAGQMALRGVPLDIMAERLRAARQPGFKPQKGERLGHFIGETLPIAALSSGIAPVVGALAPTAGPILSSAMTGAGTMGILSQLRQAEEKGKISPSETALEAGLGGAVSAAIPTGIRGLKTVGGVVKKVLPAFLRQFPKITPEATEMVLKNPEILSKRAGTPEAIEGRVLSIMDTLRKARENFGNAVGAFKKTLGIEKTDDEILDDLLSGKMDVKPLGQIKQELNILENLTKTPQNYGQIRQQAIINRARAQTPAEQNAADDLLEKVNKWKDPKERLSSILELKGQANAHSEFSKKELAPVTGEKQHGLGLLRNKLANLVKIYPGGEKLLRIKERFSRVAKVFDILQSQLPRPGKAESKLETAFRAKSTTSLLVNNKDFMNDLKELEMLTGKKLVQPLFEELAAAEFSPLLPRGGFPIGTTMAAGGAGAAFFTGHPFLGGGILAATSPKIVGKAISAGAKASKFARPLEKLMQRRGIITPTAVSVLERLMRSNENEK